MDIKKEIYTEFKDLKVGDVFIEEYQDLVLMKIDEIDENNQVVDLDDGELMGGFQPYNECMKLSLKFGANNGGQVTFESLKVGDCFKNDYGDMVWMKIDPVEMGSYRPYVCVSMTGTFHQVDNPATVFFRKVEVTIAH